MAGWRANKRKIDGWWIFFRSLAAPRGFPNLAPGPALIPIDPTESNFHPEMETAERLKQEILQMNELIARTRKAVSQLEQDLEESTRELTKFQRARKSRE